MMKKKVVIIEDQTAVREMLTQIIHHHPDFEVVDQTGNGQSALETVVRSNPDLVILDVMLPGLNGVEVLKRINKQMEGVRVLVFSGYQNPTLIRELLKAGAHGFVEKSAPLSELQKGMEQVVAGASYYGPDVAQLMREAVLQPEDSGPRTLQMLTPREREILQLIAESNSTKKVAKKLSISVKTAENHRTNMMKKLDLHDVASLTRFAIQNNLIDSNLPIRSSA